MLQKPGCGLVFAALAPSAASPGAERNPGAELIAAPRSAASRHPREIKTKEDLAYDTGSDRESRDLWFERRNRRKSSYHVFILNTLSIKGLMFFYMEKNYIVTTGNILLHPLSY